MSTPRDSVDAHIDRWSTVLPDLDADIEGVVTRMSLLTRHLRLCKEQALAARGLQHSEYETLHVLAGRKGRAAPSELAAELRMSPAAVTGRLDALEQRGYLRRTPSATDRRRVVVELTDEGYRTWQDTIDRLGHEEHRILGTLTAPERRQLADLLRRLMLAVEHP